MGFMPERFNSLVFLFKKRVTLQDKSFKDWLFKQGVAIVILIMMNVAQYNYFTTKIDKLEDKVDKLQDKLINTHTLN